ncbi:MAG: C4-dicarboxylate ABC transporter substrate-binding protein, partial [Tranquillimonas sp.]
MKLVSTLCAAAAATALMAGAAAAQTKLRIQTHHSPEAPSGQLATEFAKQVETMSGGSLEIELFHSSAVVKSAETFDAAANGILSCDMTNGTYQTGKNPAFQFVGDVMGGYDTPLQFLSWIYYGGGREEINKLYNANGMEFVGAWVGGQESLNSTK